MRADFRSIGELAVWLLARAKLPARPPRNRIARLARQLGARRIVLEDLRHEDGRLEVRGGEIVIVLSVRMPEARRNFTLAHEVAHLVLLQSDLKLTPMRRRLGLDDEERMCDQLAGALLMPEPWVTERYGRRPQTLFNLRDCAREADTSLAATTVQLTQVIRWQRLLMRWRHSADTWRLVSTAGHDAGIGHSIQSSPATCQLLEDVRTMRSGYRKTWLPLVTHGQDIVVRAEVCVSGRGGVALADLGHSRVLQQRKGSIEGQSGITSKSTPPAVSLQLNSHRSRKPFLK
jgi:hypothetical protein